MGTFGWKPGAFFAAGGACPKMAVLETRNKTTTQVTAKTKRARRCIKRKLPRNLTVAPNEAPRGSALFERRQPRCGSFSPATGYRKPMCTGGQPKPAAQCRAKGI